MIIYTTRSILHNIQADQITLGQVNGHGLVIEEITLPRDLNRLKKKLKKNKNKE